jgi:hypothetical protein
MQPQVIKKNRLQLSPTPQGWGPKEPFHFEKKLSNGSLKQNIYLKNLNTSQNILIHFFVSWAGNEDVIFKCAFDDNVSANHIFIQQIFRAAEKALFMVLKQ